MKGFYCKATRSNTTAIQPETKDPPPSVSLMRVQKDQALDNYLLIPMEVCIELQLGYRYKKPTNFRSGFFRPACASVPLPIVLVHTATRQRTSIVSEQAVSSDLGKMCGVGMMTFFFS